MITKPSSSDALRILIRDCLIHMRIGILESEQNRAQPVLVTVECTLSAGRRYYEDIKEKDITQTVDYGPLHDFITHQLPKMGHISLLESAAGEHGARMAAMDNATRNAGDMINKLTQNYNRTRQANITRELIEIISGAEAL